MEARYVTISVLAGAVTLGLFWLMQALIGVAGDLQEGGASQIVDFVRLKRDTTPETKKRELPDRKPPEQPPPPPPMNFAKSLNPDSVVGQIVPFVDTRLELATATDLGAGGTDRDVVPLVRVEPSYPMRASQRGIEGWVDVQFTIGKAGTVKDLVVLDSHPGTTFTRSALQAVSKWRYNPKVENGIPVERPGIRVRLEFRLDR
jgi:protein TonB